MRIFTIMPCRFFFILSFAVYVSAVAGHAEETSVEYQIKAAYLYNFVKFIGWPDSAFSTKESPLVIGVLGPNPFDGKLARLNSRSVRTRSIVVKYCKTLKEAYDCHLLYISTVIPSKIKSVLGELGKRPIVTVGDDREFAVQGGVIQFREVRGKLCFTINLGVAKKNGIQIDSQLLSLATSVLEAER